MQIKAFNAEYINTKENIFPKRSVLKAVKILMHLRYLQLIIINMNSHYLTSSTVSEGEREGETVRERLCV